MEWTDFQSGQASITVLRGHSVLFLELCIMLSP